MEPIALIILAAIFGGGWLAFRLVAGQARRGVKLAACLLPAGLGLGLLRLASTQMSPEAFQAGTLNATGQAGVVLMIFGLICGFGLALLSLTRQMITLSRASRKRRR